MSNCVEAALTIIALHLWQRGLLQWSTYKTGFWQFGIAVALAVTACELRPTNIFIWAVVFLDTLHKLARNPDGAPFLFLKQLLLKQSIFVYAYRHSAAKSADSCIVS